MPLNYKDSVAKLLSLSDFERKPRREEPPTFHLRRVSDLLAELGDPHLAVPVIHVAGTKGKGSVCAMVTSALAASGYKTGLFTSPHLHRITERISVDTEPISEEEFASLVDRLWPVAEKVSNRSDSGMVSVFEFLNVMAFLHFAETSVDAAVIEVGLGGRLDSTNVVQPEVTVITPIGLDHIAVLGDTLTAIAGEKAGIIKSGVPVVTASQDPEAMIVLERVAKEKKSPLRAAEKNVALTREDFDGSSPQRLRMRGRLGPYDIRLPLLGGHQVENAQVAVAAIEAFASDERDFEPSSISAGISAVEWPARIQLIEPGPPQIIADGAHNIDSAIALRASITRHFGTPENLTLILGAIGGHDILSVAGAFTDLSPKLIITASRHPKSVTPNNFAESLRAAKISVARVTQTVEAALQAARDLTDPDGMIIVTGSLFVAAEAIETVKGIAPEIYPDFSISVGPGRVS